jgi:hypothetical protein
MEISERCSLRLTCAARGIFAKLFKHVPRDETSGACDRVMGFIPLALVTGIADDIEKVPLAKGEFLGSVGAVGVEGTDDLLGRENGGWWLG